MRDALEIAKQVASHDTPFPDSTDPQYWKDYAELCATALIEAIKERDEAREDQEREYAERKRISDALDKRHRDLAQARSRVESLEAELRVIKSEAEYERLCGVDAENERLREAMSRARSVLHVWLALGKPTTEPVAIAADELTQALSPQPSQESERVPCGHERIDGFCWGPFDGVSAARVELCDGFAPTQSQEGGAG